MMETARCTSSAARMLRRIFLNSIDSTQSRLGIFAPAVFLQPRWLQTASLSQLRGYAYVAQKDNNSRRLPRDEGIRAKEVHVVDLNGTFNASQPLRQVLSAIDRTVYHLVAVKPIEPGKVPICKIVSKKGLRDRERQKPVKNRANIIKQLEINWAIDSNDLGHRLNKLQEFLEKGMRVEVILANKRKGRKASDEEAEAVVKRIRQRIGKVDGAKEWKVEEGALLKHMILHFEGKESKEKKEQIEEA